MKYIILRGNQIWSEITEDEYKSYLKEDQVSARKCIYTMWDMKMIAVAEVQAANIVWNILSRAWFWILTTFEKLRLFLTISLIVLFWFIWYVWYNMYSDMWIINVDNITKTNNESLEKKLDTTIKYLDLIWEKAKIDKSNIDVLTDDVKKKENLENILKGN